MKNKIPTFILLLFISNAAYAHGEEALVSILGVVLFLQLAPLIHIIFQWKDLTYIGYYIFFQPFSWCVAYFSAYLNVYVGLLLFAVLPITFFFFLVKSRDKLQGKNHEA